MKRVYYMTTRALRSEDEARLPLDRIGGLPTHKPTEFPAYPNGEPYGFLMQIYCDAEKFPGFDGILCWHFYQDVMEEDFPIVVALPIGAERNEAAEGMAIPRLEPRMIEYEEGTEPDELSLNFGAYTDEEEERYYSSKIRGAIVGLPHPDYEYVGKIFEHICDDLVLNFGIESVCLLKNRRTGELELE